MAGIYSVCRKMRPLCPDCGSVLDVGALGNEMFRRILKALMAGTIVRVENFGSFRVHLQKGGYQLRTVHGDTITRRSTRFVRLRMSPAARLALNGSQDDIDKVLTKKVSAAALKRGSSKKKKERGRAHVVPHKSDLETTNK